MLEYEEELELSDLLVARRAVNQELKESGEPPSPEQRRIIRRGDQAATELVENYLPFIRKSASLVYSRIIDGGSSGMEFDDLVNEGVIAAIKTANSFNARGRDGRRGVRFATYSKMAVLKAMNRLVAKSSTPLYMDVSAIQATWKWNAIKADLTVELGRPPTDEEMEERTEMSASYVAPDLPGRRSFADVADPESADLPDPMEAVISIQSEYDHAADLLGDLFDKILPTDLRDVAKSRFGLDIMRPRDEVGVSEHLGITKASATRSIAKLENLLAHPMYRVWAKEEMARLDPEGRYKDIGQVVRMSSEAE